MEKFQQDNNEDNPEHILYADKDGSIYSNRPEGTTPKNKSKIKEDPLAWLKKLRTDREAKLRKENPDLANLEEDFRKLYRALSNTERENLEKNKISLSDGEGMMIAEKYEGYLKDNFDKLSQAQKDFLLIKLRLMNFHLQNPKSMD